MCHTIPITSRTRNEMKCPEHFCVPELNGKYLTSKIIIMFVFTSSLPLAHYHFFLNQLHGCTQQMIIIFLFSSLLCAARRQEMENTDCLSIILSDVRCNMYALNAKEIRLEAKERKNVRFNIQDWRRFNAPPNRAIQSMPIYLKGRSTHAELRDEKKNTRMQFDFYCFNVKPTTKSFANFCCKIIDRFVLH